MREPQIINMICKIKKADEGEEKKNIVDNKRTM
jgi:hypothetical protein